MDSREERLKPDAPCPLSPGWADDLYADDFVPPLGWPPQAVFGPDTVRRHVERSEALRRARMERATCNGGGEHRSEINESALVSESARAILRLSIKLTLSG